MAPPIRLNNLDVLDVPTSSFSLNSLPLRISLNENLPNDFGHHGDYFDVSQSLNASHMLDAPVAKPNHSFSDSLTVKVKPSPRQAHAIPAHVISPETQSDSAGKAAKILFSGIFPTDGEPVTFADVCKVFAEHFPGEDYEFVGDKELRNGLFMWSKSDPLHAIFVRDSCYIPKKFITDDSNSRRKVTGIEYGGAVYRKHIEVVTLDSTNQALKDYNHALMYALQDPDNLHETRADFLSGFLGIGMEWEFLLYPKKFPLKLAEIAHDELPVGMIEVDLGVHLRPDLAGLAMARMHQMQKMKYDAELGGCLLVSVGTPPTGKPQDTDLNEYLDWGRNQGAYIAAVNFRYLQEFEYGPKSDQSRQVRDQQAQAHGYKDFNQLFQEIGLKAWTVLATHINKGSPNRLNPQTGKFQTEATLYHNTLDLVNSELGGAVTRTLLASSPYLTGVAPKVDGKFVRDVRDIIKKDPDTADSPDAPIGGSENHRDILKEAVTGKHKATRLDRASVTRKVQLATGEKKIKFIQHGQSRARIVDTGGAMIRVENTGPSASSILPKIRAMAVSQMLQIVALAAVVEKQNSLDYATNVLGLTPQDVWGDVDVAVTEFNFNGPNSQKIQTIVARLKKVFAHVYQEYQLAAVSDIYETAMAALDSLLVEGDLQDFANGKGTLGGALIKLAELGMTGDQIAVVIDSFQQQEAQAILEWTKKGRFRKLREYRLGLCGFNFVMPIDLSGFSQNPKNE